FKRRVERDRPNKKNHRDDHGGQKLNSDKVGPHVQFPRPAWSPRLHFAVVRLRQFGICFELFDQSIVGDGLSDAHPGEDRHEEEHGDDRDVIGRRRDGPQLMPILNVDRPERDDHQEHYENGPLVDESSHWISLVIFLPQRRKDAKPAGLQVFFLCFFFASLRLCGSHFFFATALTSDSSITGAGPEMPPSFLMRQKCTAINIDATSGIPMQCQMYERSSAFESTIDPPSSPKRTSL